MNGWIKIHRKLIEHPRFKDPEWVSVWVFLLMSAAHAEHRIIFDGEETVLRPGQFVSGRHVIAKGTGVSEPKVRRVLDILKHDGQIGQRAGTTGSLFTILNWGSYQNEELFAITPKTGQPSDQQIGQPTDQPQEARSLGNHGAESTSCQNSGQRIGQPIDQRIGQQPANERPQHKNVENDKKGKGTLAPWQVIALSDEVKREAVLDPFCGCGTTIDAAEKLGRKWIGIDITQLATSLIKNRLRDAYADKIEIVTIGEPATPNEAATLAEQDKYQFQWWALGLVGARPVEQKKGADHGIDGKILFRDDPRSPKPEQIIIQVKGGKTGVKDVRDLVGVLDREKAAIGVLISLQGPTSHMEAEAATAGFYTHKANGLKYPRLQLRTVKELMDGKTIERPSSIASVDETFRKAPKAEAKGHEQTALEL